MQYSQPIDSSNTLQHYLWNAGSTNTNAVFQMQLTKSTVGTTIKISYMVYSLSILSPNFQIISILFFPGVIGPGGSYSSTILTTLNTTSYSYVLWISEIYITGTIWKLSSNFYTTPNRVTL